MEYTKNKIVEYLPEFMEALKKQLEDDEKRWGDTWKKRPIEGQEERMQQSLNDYYDKFKNGHQPYPTLKAIGGFLINWIREYERDSRFENLATDLLNKTESFSQDAEIGTNEC